MLQLYKIQKAIKFAIKTHEVYDKQKRKGKDIPYITHPLTVGLILSQSGASDDVVCAGILHDTIEDSIPVKKVTYEMLEERFGKEVVELVLAVTEQNKDLPWEERKRQAIEHVKTFSHDAVLVKSADLISNLTELLDDYEKDGESVFERFNAPKDKKIKNTLETITAVISQWPESPLVQELRYLAGQLQMIGAVRFMPNYPAKIIEYKDYDENVELECLVCGWTGTPKLGGCINTDSHYAMDISCPNCDKMLLVVSYPLA